MDVPTLKLVLSPILTVLSVWNTGETGDLNDVTNFRVNQTLANRGLALRFAYETKSSLNTWRQISPDCFASKGNG